MMFTRMLQGVVCLLACLLFSCSSEPDLPPSNQLYENIYDDVLHGQVKQLVYPESGLVLRFDCDRRLISRKMGADIWEYQYQQDTILNSIATRQKLLYPINEDGRVSAYISKVWDGEKWYDHYRQDWIYDDKGRLSEKQIFSVKEAEADYFIHKEKYTYLPDGKVEITKYGKDVNAQKQQGILRTETRRPNQEGHWASIRELDEDGIPYRLSSYTYEYDAKGNWTTVITDEVNHYTGKRTVDTIYREVVYHSDCE